MQHFSQRLFSMSARVCAGAAEVAAAKRSLSADGIQVLGRVTDEFADVVTPDAVRFVARLQRRFNSTRLSLLQRRIGQQLLADAGRPLSFPKETAAQRAAEWRAVGPAAGLVDRRVEITGPSSDRKMVINALNSGATQYMADFEDATTPTWENMLLGQINVRDSNDRTITFESPDGKKYKLNDKIATLIVRPRGWHLDEKHLLVDGAPTSGSLFDFGLYFYHNVERSARAGIGPYFYLPKMESYLEARLWNDVFLAAQEALGLPRGTIRATCLIETLPAAFQMDEFIYELREHSAGLNCGRWDYIFSSIKTMRANKNFVLPDRGFVTMTTPFLQAYVRLLVATCHRRGVHAMGGMSAHIPNKSDTAQNSVAMQAVENDKLREVRAGHDGTWVAHPGLVPIAKSIFDKYMPQPNQLDVTGDLNVAPEELTSNQFTGQLTEKGVQNNIDAALNYLASWLNGIGCVPINNLMEDAATAEIARTQLWQWQKYGASTVEGTLLTPANLAERIEKTQKALVAGGAPHSNRMPAAAKALTDLVTNEGCAPFLTSYLYDGLLTLELD